LNVSDFLAGEIRSFRIWSLEFFWDLELGIWIFPYGYSGQ
jgi:hypothetical protein